MCSRLTYRPGVTERAPRAPREDEEEREATDGHADHLHDDDGAEAVVAADREAEADRRHHEDARHADRPLQHDRGRHLARPAAATSRVLDDPQRVSAETGGQHLPCRVADEVDADEPPERLA